MKIENPVRNTSEAFVIKDEIVGIHCLSTRVFSSKKSVGVSHQREHAVEEHQGITNHYLSTFVLRGRRKSKVDYVSSGATTQAAASSCNELT
ncbi:hypothetical protein PILCRDRAFT_820791 [Piloderma croceum F 1598]|uniref:Uncharacterized protein n=1 Tax=Piloderma croceum (strain F 1598) TaxID=765440 RepID=A0A0C3FQC4_PILCF|nr:hypothetical protein PILCRDRAFT_820791 [Piloderma croceum F 1598]